MPTYTLRAVELRPAELADLPAQREIFCAAEGELCRRHGFPFVPPPEDVLLPMYAHALRYDAERCFVAEEGGRVLGFTAALARGNVWILAALFVRPEAQGRGIGSRLLDLVWGASFEQRITLTDSIQPIANAMYARRGLAATAAVFAMRGRPRVESSVLEAAPTDALALASIDLAARGFDRGVDHLYWARASRSATLWRRRGEAVGYSYVWSNGAIGPLAGASPQAAAMVLTAELARLAAAEVSIQIPTTAIELISAALAAGLRVEAPPELLLVSPLVLSPRSWAISSYFLI